MKKKLIAWIAVASAIMPLTASAHSIWINMSNWNPSFGYENKAWSTMYIGWGHRFPVDGFTIDKPLILLILLHLMEKEKR